MCVVELHNLNFVFVIFPLFFYQQFGYVFVFLALHFGLEQQKFFFYVDCA